MKRYFFAFILTLLAINPPLLAQSQMGGTWKVGRGEYRITCLDPQEVELVFIEKDYHSSMHIPKVVQDSLGGTFKVTGVAAEALMYNTYTTELTLPSSVRTIGYRAFCNSSLARIELPEGLEEIGDEAFRECESLECLTIPASVRRIGKGAFYGAVDTDERLMLEEEGLEKIIPLNGLKRIEVARGSEHFMSKGGVLFSRDGEELVAYPPARTEKHNHVPGGVERIAPGAFATTWELRQVTLPESLESIGREVFRECTRLRKVNIPKRVSSIGGGVFEGCHNLRELNLSIENPHYELGGDALFSKDRKRLIYYFVSGQKAPSRYEIPATVEEILGGAFAHRRRLQEIVIPESVRVIGARAFSACTAIREVHLPSRLDSLGPEAFSNCARLARVVWPRTLSSVGESYTCVMW